MHSAFDSNREPKRTDTDLPMDMDFHMCVGQQ